MKKAFLVILPSLAALVLTQCGALKQNRADAPEVPIAITIKGNDPDLSPADLNYFMHQFLNELEEFQRVNLTIAEPQENPDIDLELDIQSFTIWPKDQRISRRVFTRTVVVGQDSKGRPVYGTVRASADIIQEQYRADARFSTKLQIKGTPGKNFSRVFTPRYRTNLVYVDNIQGDSRAIDPSIYAAVGPPPFDPEPHEFLLALAKEEMTDRLRNEIRSYYKK